MKKLQVPDNISLRKEIIRGIGGAELLAMLAVTGVVLAGGVVFCVVSTSEKDSVFATVAVVFALAASMGFFAKMDNGQSICDYLRRQANYVKEQQRFLYKRKEALEYVSEEQDPAEGVDGAGFR